MNPGIVIYSDLDGTLLDSDTYSWAEAEPALAQCRQLSVPVILNSSKTHAEMAHLRQILDLPWPYIVENGGGILYPRESYWLQPSNGIPEGEFLRQSIGLPYRHVCAALKLMEIRTGWPLKGFSDMTLDEIMALTGLDRADAERAAKRDYDEPFCVNRSHVHDTFRIGDAAARLGLRVTPGGRFFHLHGQFDKGKALRILNRLFLKAWGPVKTVGLGDSENDFSMLEAVDCPIWVASHDRPVPTHIPNLITLADSGPRAWNQAVLNVLMD